MKTSIAFLTTLALVTVSAAPKKRNSKSWAGANLYFLQGLSDADQNTYISNLKSYGTKVVRVWVNAQPGGGACEKGSKIASSAPDLETSIGSYNDQTLALLDKAIAKIAAAGMKALISPHDGNSLGGSNEDIYGRTYGSGYFYNQQNAMNQYDARLSHIINYVSPSSGKAWKDWHEAIMGFDIQNEPMSAKTEVCKDNDQAGWLCGRAAHMRSVLGAENPIKIGSGGIGGDYSQGCNLMQAALDCPELDMVSIHRYAGTEASGQANWKGAAQGWLAATHKMVYVEEFGIDSTKADQASEFPANTDDIDSAAIPWIYWQVLPPKTCSVTDSDNFGIYMNAGVDLKDPFTKATQVNAAQDWTGVIY